MSRILNEEELLQKEAAFDEIIVSHHAQTEYIHAQEEAAQGWLAENKRLRNIEIALNELPPGLETQEEILAWLESTTGFIREVLDDTDKH